MATKKPAAKAKKTTKRNAKAPKRGATTAKRTRGPKTDAAALAGKVFETLQEHPEGLRAEQLKLRLGIKSTPVLAKAMAMLKLNNAVRVTGRARSTLYFANPGRPATASARAPRVGQGEPASLPAAAPGMGIVSQWVSDGGPIPKGLCVLVLTGVISQVERVAPVQAPALHSYEANGVSLSAS